MIDKHALLGERIGFERRETFAVQLLQLKTSPQRDDRIRNIFALGQSRFTRGRPNSSRESLDLRLDVVPRKECRPDFAIDIGHGTAAAMQNRARRAESALLSSFLTLSLAPCVLGKLLARTALIFTRWPQGSPQRDTIDDIRRSCSCLLGEEADGDTGADVEHARKQGPWHHSVPRTRAFSGKSLPRTYP